jgi:hypothetical protein
MGEKLQEHETVKMVIRTTRIIVIALIVGVVFFGGFLVTMGLANRQPNQILIAYIAAGFAAVAIPTSIFASSALANKAVQSIAAGTFKTPGQMRHMQIDDDLSRLALVYQQKTIVAGAFLEGAAFFNLVAYMLEGQNYSLLIAVGLVALLAVHIPRTPAVETWLEHRLERVAAERGMF